MNEPTQEELKRFWLKCGFYQEKIKEVYDIGYSTIWRHKQGYFESKLPSLTLDNLFKYGVTKALKEIRLWVLLRKWYEEIVNLAGTDEIKDNRIVILSLYHVLNKVLEG